MATKGKSARKQPFAYAKRGQDGRWYHWRQLARLGVTIGAALLVPSAARAISDYFGLEEMLSDGLDWIGGLWKE